MSDEEFEEEPDLELDDPDLVDDVVLLADDDDDDLLVDVELAVAVDDLEVVREVPVPVVTDTTATETPEEEDDDVVDLDEELHPDDVEEPLDVLLQERTASATLEDDEEELEEEEADGDERGEGPARIVPRRPGEFLCSSCFLVLPRNQLADEKRMLCRDCA